MGVFPRCCTAYVYTQRGLLGTLEDYDHGFCGCAPGEHTFFHDWVLDRRIRVRTVQDIICAFTRCSRSRDERDETIEMIEIPLLDDE